MKWLWIMINLMLSMTLMGRSPLMDKNWNYKPPVEEIPECKPRKLILNFYMRDEMVSVVCDFATVYLNHEMLLCKCGQIPAVVTRIDDYLQVYCRDCLQSKDSLNECYFGYNSFRVIPRD